jgi:hypothetical protein
MMRWRIAPKFGRARQSAEYALHRFDALNIGARLMVPAALRVGQLESTSRELIAGAGTAQMDQRREHLFVLQRRGGDPMAFENRGDAVIKIGGGQLDRVAGQYAGV